MKPISEALCLGRRASLGLVRHGFRNHCSNGRQGLFLRDVLILWILNRWHLFMTRARNENGRYELLHFARMEPEKVEILNLYLDWRDWALPAIPDDIGIFKNLAHLFVWGISLDRIPEDLFKLPKLKNFQATALESEGFPEMVFRLTKLEELGVDESQIRSLPDRFDRLPNLRSLDLSYNELSSLPESMGHLRKLEEVNLSCNKLEELPSSWSNFPSLRSLDVGGNPIPDRLLEPFRHCLV